VRKVPWPATPDSLVALSEAIRFLARDSAGRAALGKAGLNHVRERHAWPVVAARLAEALVAPAPGWLRGPHPATDRESVRR
jgi:hypothetical protein